MTIEFSLCGPFEFAQRSCPARIRNYLWDLQLPMENISIILLLQVSTELTQMRSIHNSEIINVDNFCKTFESTFVSILYKSFLIYIWFFSSLKHRKRIRNQIYLRFNARGLACFLLDIISFYF